MESGFFGAEFFKDLQDALIYTRHGVKDFSGSYMKGMKGIAGNSAEWQLYQGAGGFASSIFENMVGTISGCAKRAGIR
jgi:hypothetical protein